MSRQYIIIFAGAALVCGTVFAALPAQRPHIKPVKKVQKKEKVVNLGQPIQAIALDSVLENGHMSVIANDGQFAEVLFQPFTRTRRQGSLVGAEQVPDGERMVIWGKWDSNNPNVFKALAVSCRERLSDIVVRQKVALACQNISQRRTLASTPAPERHVVIMTAPAPSVTLPTANPRPVAVAPLPPSLPAPATPASAPAADISRVVEQ